MNVFARPAAVLAAGLAVYVAAGRWWALTVLPAGLAWASAEFRRRRPVSVVAVQGPRDFSNDQRTVLFDRWHGHCAYCRRPIHYGGDCPDGDCGLDYEADHVYPYSLGGPTILSNGVAACRDDNRSKGDRLLADYLADPGPGSPLLLAGS